MEKTYKILKVLIWVLLFVVLMAGAYVLYQNLGGRAELGGLATQPPRETAEASQSAEQTEQTEQAPVAAPDFTVYDLEGNAHKLSDFVGKPVILNFWASWCGPCKSEMPDIDQAYQVYGEQIHFLLVNLTDGAQETVASACAYIQEQGYSFPIYYDTDVDGARAYAVNSIPVTYFIDAEGNLAAYYRGAMPQSILQQGIDLLLNAEESE